MSLVPSASPLYPQLKYFSEKRLFLKTAETLLSSGSDLTGSDLTIKTELFVLKKVDSRTQ